MHRARKLSFVACSVSFAIGVCTGAAAQSPRHAMRAIPSGNPAAWFAPDDYPADAVRAQCEGRVVVIVGVDAAGGVTSCDIDVSSGTAALDQRTCDLARSRGHFDPATDDAGRPIAGTYRLPVKWTIPNPSPMTTTVPEPIDLTTGAFERSAEIETLIDEKGDVTGCRTLSKSANLDRDPCANATIGLHIGQIFVRDGKRVKVAYRQRTSVFVQPVSSDP